ncbi:MAG: glycosyltransferase [Gammaproteobacteria bacterium]|nr:glycosyltransferase [Gammaproteobacteria bacterium]NVK89237.1 glycosyltransferase [Gammaproteobacteria bacterium]
MSLHFCIFSFNRGRFLNHCVTSIERLAPGYPITIVDDNSDDPDTQQVLSSLADRHQVVQPAKEEGASKHGGLYHNMQVAFERLPETALACFIQDDMQLVRALNTADIADIQGYFSANQDCAILHPAFLKASNRKRDQQSMTWSETEKCYRRAETGASAGVYYSDVSIFHVARLRQHNWRFDQGEKNNEKQARQLFQPMGFLANPFVMWLPNVSAYRGKTKTLGLRIAEQVSKSGFYPIAEMTESQSTLLQQRDRTATLPVAEDFLTLVNPGELAKPWFFYPLEKRKILRQLDRIELKLTRLFK